MSKPVVGMDYLLDTENNGYVFGRFMLNEFWVCAAGAWHPAGRVRRYASVENFEWSRY